MLKKAGILHRNGAVDFQAALRPASDPVTVVQHGMPRVAVAHERFVMTASRAYGTRPALLASLFPAHVTALEKRRLPRLVQAGGNMTKRMLIGIDKPVTRRQVSGRPYADQPQPGATRMRLIDSLVQLG